MDQDLQEYVQARWAEWRSSGWYKGRVERIDF